MRASDVVPTEAQEQATLCEWLELHGICYAHVPNEGKRSRVGGHNLKRQGMQPGFPDILVLDPVPSIARIGDHAPGVAIELKRIKGGVVRDSQREWLERLRLRGWHAHICYGADEAIRYLEGLGYGRRTA